MKTLKLLDFTVQMQSNVWDLINVLVKPGPECDMCQQSFYLQGRYAG